LSKKKNKKEDKVTAFVHHEQFLMVQKFLINLIILILLGLLGFRLYTKTNAKKVEKKAIKKIRAEINTIEEGGEEF